MHTWLGLGLGLGIEMHTCARNIIPAKMRKDGMQMNSRNGEKVARSDAQQLSGAASADTAGASLRVRRSGGTWLG